MKNKLVIGSRGSPLARWQAEFVRSKILQWNSTLSVSIRIIRTRGDKDNTTPLPELGDKGFFTGEIESALRKGEIDLAVHSLKDLPVEFPEDLKLGAVPLRDSPYDVLVGEVPFFSLPTQAVVATSSVRRKAQLLHLRPDLRVVEVRGNVETRLKKMGRQRWDGLVMAEAALNRLELTGVSRFRFSLDQMVPAAGQGVIAVEVAHHREDLEPVLKTLNHDNTFREVEAEFRFISLMEGGCKIPAGALAKINDNRLHLTGMVASQDGKKLIKDSGDGDVGEAKKVAEELYQRLIARGAREILNQRRIGVSEAV